MSPTGTRLAALAAVAAMGIAAPVAGASAFSAPAFAGLPSSGLPSSGVPFSGLPFSVPAFPATGLGDFKPAPLSFVGPSVGQVAAVIGPTIITTAPATFINTNTQVTAGSAVAGPQVGP
jgi:hypothetical protein